MDDLLTTILSLIPIALIIGIQILVKRQKTVEQAEAARRAAEKPATAPVLGEAAKRAASTLRLSNDEKVFTAHSLTVDDDVTVVPKKNRGAMLDRPGEAARRELTSRPETAPAARHQAASEARLPEPRLSHQPAADFQRTLQHLSPLKQAIVMAELLGPPLAIRTQP